MEDRINDVHTNVSTCVCGVHCFYRIIVASARRADAVLTHAVAYFDTISCMYVHNYDR